METFDRDFESSNPKLHEQGQSFENDNYEEQLSMLKKKKDIAKKEQAQERKKKMKQLLKNDNNEKVDNREKVQEFIRNNCVEPIDGVEKIIPFSKFAQIMLKSAEEEVIKEQNWISKIKNKRVLRKIQEGDAKCKAIYELPAYKDLIEKGGFILPSDLRNYYESVNRQPVHHLGIDYNVKAGTEVKSMYNGKVVSSGLDGGFGHKVIIEHETDDGIKFYSLYGHLSSKGLPKIGDSVERGEKIGEVGIYEENGHWNSHLHFQIMEKKDSKPGFYEGEGEDYNVITGNYDVLKSFGK